MSQSNALRFLQRVSTDEAYRADLNRAVADQDDAITATASRAAQDGFEFSAEDLRAALEGARARSDELTDDALEEVSGGFNPQPTPPAIQQPSDTYIRDLFGSRVRLRF